MKLSHNVEATLIEPFISNKGQTQDQALVSNALPETVKIINKTQHQKEESPMRNTIPRKLPLKTPD